MSAGQADVNMDQELSRRGQGSEQDARLVHAPTIFSFEVSIS